MEETLTERYERIIREDGRFPLGAYDFLNLGLDFTTRARFGAQPAERARHVTGQELCEGLRRLALGRWGLLAQTVLARWNIRRTRDFGEMVFLLVEHDVMGRQESDSIEDFDDVYDFDEAFGRYEIPLHEVDAES